MIDFFVIHLQIFANAVTRLVRSPFASLMTFAVIAIAMALPATVFIIAYNLQPIADEFSHSAQLSVFLETGIDGPTIRARRKQLLAMPHVETVEHLSAAQALDEFREMSGLGESLDRLPANPLPETLLVGLAHSVIANGQISALADQIRTVDGVDQVIVDASWLARLRTLLALAKRVGVALGLLMSLGVVLVIGNTVSLAVLNRGAEIEIIDLVGGTAAFIRRPFLYSGLLQGMIGGVFAWALAWLMTRLLANQVVLLASHYGGSFTLISPGWLSLLILIVTAGGLGWLASRIAVGVQLNRVIRHVQS